MPIVSPAATLSARIPAEIINGLMERHLCAVSLPQTRCTELSNLPRILTSTRQRKLPAYTLLEQEPLECTIRRRA